MQKIDISKIVFFGLVIAVIFGSVFVTGQRSGADRDAAYEFVTDIILMVRENFVADLLNISEAAVGQRISRARKRLASELDRMDRGPKLRVPLPRKKAG